MKRLLQESDNFATLQALTSDGLSFAMHLNRLLALADQVGIQLNIFETLKYSYQFAASSSFHSSLSSWSPSGGWQSMAAWNLSA
jgi:hypothetical protein